MLLEFNSLMYAVSFGLDCVEHDVLGATTNHGKRVAYLSVRLGQLLDYQAAQLQDLMACAIMHDNALAQAVRTEINARNVGKMSAVTLKTHCELGEENTRIFPFGTAVENVIRYHHENCDGSGPYHLPEEQIPPMAMLIHLADIMDLGCRLGMDYPDKKRRIADFLRQSEGYMFTKKSVELFRNLEQDELLEQLLNERINVSLPLVLPERRTDYSLEQLRKIADFFAVIIDNKSSFTRRHSLGIAAKAEKLGLYLGDSRETADKLYIAGALHDIGKLAVPLSILEKPGKLTSSEFSVMKKHAWFSYEILRQIQGLEEIAAWAYAHHEKLDGSGYPFGTAGDKLSRNQRLMCCVDIYQALSEQRPYKKPFSHEACMKIMNSMADIGKIDKDITAAIGILFAPKQ